MHSIGKIGQNESVSARKTVRASVETRRQDAIESAEKESYSMDKPTMKGIAVLVCLVLLTTLAVCAVGAQVDRNGGMGGALREGGRAVESMAGDAMQGAESAVGDMVGEITGGDGAFSDGTNIPEDSSGVITEPDTTVRETERQTERQTTADTVTGEVTGGQEMAGEDEGGSGFVGLLVAAIIAVAVILLIVALMPKKRENR